MHITEVKIELVTGEPRLLAFAKVVFDGCFVTHDVKVIQADHGLLVAMPSKKIEDRCPYCRQKNPLRAKYCNDCGKQLANDRAPKAEDGRAKLFTDVVHPIVMEMRDYVTFMVLGAYRQAIRSLPTVPTHAVDDEQATDETADAEFGEGLLV